MRSIDVLKKLRRRKARSRREDDVSSSVLDESDFDRSLVTDGVAAGFCAPVSRSICLLLRVADSGDEGAAGSNELFRARVSCFPEDDSGGVIGERIR